MAKYQVYFRMVSGDCRRVEVETIPFEESQNDIVEFFRDKVLFTRSVDLPKDNTILKGEYIESISWTKIDE